MTNKELVGTNEEETVEKARRSAIAKKALRTATWARTMTKWLITHSSKGGVKWEVITFKGAKGHESKGIVDMIAIRKDHTQSEAAQWRGDLFEIVLIQAKGGSSPFPTPSDVDRLIAVKNHHNATKVVLTEWKQGKTLCCYVLPDMKIPVPAAEIFGKVPTKKQVAEKVEQA